jgi:hypothetical protein
MKIRTGFVSNSSSSSFVAWGISKDEIVLPDSFYLDKFSTQLEYYNGESKLDNDWYKKYHQYRHEDMLGLKTDKEKVEYAKEHIASELGNDDFEQGGQENDFLGLTVDWFMKKHPEMTFGEVTTFVAKKLNEEYGTNFDKSDIAYREEGWYNG